MDDIIARFCSITGVGAETASKYLHLTEGKLDEAIALFFDNDSLFPNQDEQYDHFEETATSNSDQVSDEVESEQTGQMNRIYTSQGSIVRLK